MPSWRRPAWRQRVIGDRRLEQLGYDTANLDSVAAIERCIDEGGLRLEGEKALWQRGREWGWRGAALSRAGSGSRRRSCGAVSLL